MTRRTFAAAGVIAGTIALLVGANTNAWWTAREGKQTLRFGLRSLTSWSVVTTTETSLG